jgi:hypothetical protein
VVSYHAVLDSIVVINKGSQLATKNLAYDAETGEVLVTRTNNEFNQPVYATSYPAWWAYSGMGLAYKNIDAVYTGVNFNDGRITNSGFDLSGLESGDELLIISGAGGGCSALLAPTGSLIWVYDINKNSTSLAATRNLIFLDAGGKPFNMTNVTCRVIRSGRRNMLDAKVATVTSMVNPLATGQLRFDTASRVVNVAATEYREKWQVDTDVIKRLKLVTTNCTPTEVPDSLGYLEKSINPYRKGLIGNFKPWNSKVFYERRREYDTTANTNIALNGFLANFKLYWDFNGSGSLVPDSNSTQWVYNNRLNRINARGLELETEDALGIATAAQYGYKKTQPIAIANNARSTEMVTENFEDYTYDEAINGNCTSCGGRSFDYTGAYLASADGAGFRPHTGRYAFGVNAGATASRKYPVQTTANSYSLGYRPDTLRSYVLSNPGGNILANNQATPNAWYLEPVFFQNNVGVRVAIGPNEPFVSNYAGQMVVSQYFQITQSGNCVMTLERAHSGISINASWIVSVEKMDTSTGSNQGTTIYRLSLDASNSTYDTTIFLCQGFYRVVGFTTIYGATPVRNGFSTFLYSLTSSTNNFSSTGYKNIAFQDICYYTAPIAGADAMLNPPFSIPAGKQMLFSGWVRENCGNAAGGIPCKDYTYTHNEVQLKFQGNSSNDVLLKPAGPIIDGWQRYEGVFTAPANATAMTMNFVNSGATPVYFDDIRLQPFNANVKSYVYDPINLRLVAEMDANNYATFYEYDEEGTLVRTKVETRQGIKTITETRSALQKIIQ